MNRHQKLILQKSELLARQYFKKKTPKKPYSKCILYFVYFSDLLSLVETCTDHVSCESREGGNTFILCIFLCAGTEPDLCCGLSNITCNCKEIKSI